mgnify:CR=1 FL=1
MAIGEKKTGIVVVLIVIILILLGIIAYFFAIKPAIDSYVVKKQGEAVEGVLTIMLLQVQQQGFTQINNRQFNQSLILVPYVPQQQSQEQPIV